jgi:peroxiredoxin
MHRLLPAFLALLSAAAASAEDKPESVPQSEQARKLAEIAAGSKDRIPAEARKIMADAQAELKASGIEGRALKVGDKAPAFELTGFDGTRVSSAELLRHGPLAVVFYRGGWCPYCNVQLAFLQKAHADIRAAGGRVVAVSPQTAEKTKAALEKNPLSFPVLCDRGNEVAAKFGLVFTLPEPLVGVYNKFGIDLKASNGVDRIRLPLPATYVIDRAGTIRWAFVDSDYRKCAEPADIVRALKAAAEGK